MTKVIILSQVKCKVQFYFSQHVKANDRRQDWQFSLCNLGTWPKIMLTERLQNVDTKFLLLKDRPLFEDVEIKNDESTTLISLGQALKSEDTSAIETMFGYLLDGANE